MRILFQNDCVRVLSSEPQTLLLHSGVDSMQVFVEEGEGCPFSMTTVMDDKAYSWVDNDWESVSCRGRVEEPDPERRQSSSVSCAPTW